MLLKQRAHLSKIDNVAVSGTQMTGPNGLPAQVNKVNFKNYNYALIAFGTNDYLIAHESLPTMQASLQSAVDSIKGQNPHIKFFLTTPIQSFTRPNEDMNTLNNMGVSQNEIDNMIINVAKANHLQYNDWRQHPIVTPENHLQTLGDQKIHPTATTMALMADRYYHKFFKTQAKIAQPVKQVDKPVTAHQSNGLLIPTIVVIVIFIMAVVLAILTKKINH